MESDVSQLHVIGVLSFVVNADDDADDDVVADDDADDEEDYDDDGDQPPKDRQGGGYPPVGGKMG